MMGITTKEWDDLPSPGIIFCQISRKEVFQTEPVNDKTKKTFSHNKGNARVMRAGDTILAAAPEYIIDESLCLLKNQSPC